MTKPTPLSYATFGVAFLALLLSTAGLAGGYAAAARHKIGKNLVVTRSIKNGAVTGKKVKDGTLTTADLAPGTIPAPGTGKAVEFAVCNCLLGGPNQTAAMLPVGFTQGAPVAFVTPVAIQIADFHVAVPTQTAGQSATFSFQYQPPNSVQFVLLDMCTVNAGERSCVSAATPTIPAGSNFFLQGRSGPGGATGSAVEIGYTLHVS